MWRITLCEGGPRVETITRAERDGDPVDTDDWFDPDVRRRYNAAARAAGIPFDILPLRARETAPPLRCATSHRIRDDSRAGGRVCA